MSTKVRSCFSKIWNFIKNDNLEKTNTDWKSIYVATFVALLSSMQSYTVNPTLWPYIKFVNPGVTETANGAFQGAAAIGNALSSFVAGYYVNRFSTTKPQLIASKLIMIIAALFYFGIELNFNAAVVLLIIFQLLSGISGGVGSVYRTHISMATQESERSRAFGLSMLATAVGSIVGPLTQMLFALIHYPGLPLLFGTHFNMFTGPVYLTLLTSIIGFLLFIFFFNGDLSLHKKDQAPKDQEVDDVKLTSYSRMPSISETSTEVSLENMIEKEVKFDKIAVIVLIITKVTQDINILVLMSIAMPYSMTVFEWSSKDLIVVQSILMAPMGLCSLAFAMSYIKFKLDKKIPERIALIFGLSLFLIFYLATFPWPFLSQTIPYAHEKGAPVYFNQAEAQASLLALNQTSELVGCNVNYSWCESTPRINVIVFGGFAILILGLGMPLSSINLDILYSKVLGPIKQGVLQAVIQAAGQVINVVGPILVTLVYTYSGPRWLWLFEIIVTGLCILLLGIFYPRLISYSTRVENKLDKRRKVELP